MSVRAPSALAAAVLLLSSTCALARTHARRHRPRALPPGTLYEVETSPGEPLGVSLNAQLSVRSIAPQRDTAGLVHVGDILAGVDGDAVWSLSTSSVRNLLDAGDTEAGGPSHVLTFLRPTLSGDFARTTHLGPHAPLSAALHNTALDYAIELPLAEVLSRQPLGATFSITPHGLRLDAVDPLVTEAVAASLVAAAERAPAGPEVEESRPPSVPDDAPLSPSYASSLLTRRGLLSDRASVGDYLVGVGSASLAGMAPADAAQVLLSALGLQAGADGVPRAAVAAARASPEGQHPLPLGWGSAPEELASACAAAADRAALWLPSLEELLAVEGAVEAVQELTPSPEAEGDGEGRGAGEPLNPTTAVVAPAAHATTGAASDQLAFPAVEGTGEATLAPDGPSPLPLPAPSHPPSPPFLRLCAAFGRTCETIRAVADVNAVRRLACSPAGGASPSAPPAGTLTLHFRRPPALLEALERARRAHAALSSGGAGAVQKGQPRLAASPGQAPSRMGAAGDASAKGQANAAKGPQRTPSRGADLASRYSVRCVPEVQRPASCGGADSLPGAPSMPRCSFRASAPVWVGLLPDLEGEEAASGAELVLQSQWRSREEGRGAAAVALTALASPQAGLVASAPAARGAHASAHRDGGAQPAPALATPALFGGAFPCAPRRLVIASPADGCDPLRTAGSQPRKGVPEAAGSAPDSYRGAIVLVRRGGCTFPQKAHRLQDAGAAGMLLVGSDDSPPLALPGAEPPGSAAAASTRLFPGEGVAIPVAAVARSEGEVLMAAVRRAHATGRDALARLDTGQEEGQCYAEFARHFQREAESSRAGSGSAREEL